MVSSLIQEDSKFLPIPLKSFIYFFARTILSQYFHGLIPQFSVFVQNYFLSEALIDYPN